MATHEAHFNATHAPRYQVPVLQFATVFFAILVIPLDYKFYAWIFTGEWLDFQITRLIKIVSYLPSFFNELNNEQQLGIGAFASWGVALLLAIIGVVVWQQLEKKGSIPAVNYERLYAWFRVVLRYKLALILISFGSLKLCPLQFPFPSLSNLHTNYGDFLPWKIWYHTLGITPNYTAFLGGVELLAGLLLCSNKTVGFGAALTLGVHINVVFSSFSYQLGNQVFATFVFLVATILFVHDVPRLYSLLYQAKITAPEKELPLASERVRLVARALFFVLASVIFLSALFNYKHDPYLIPKTPGLPNAAGLYNVREFIFNNDTLPYSRVDPNRWQNVIFEEWATLSIRTAKPVIVDSTLYLTAALADIDRVYESAGVDGRRYFSYTADSTGRLQLVNKNRHHAAEKYTLTVLRPDPNTIILEGVNENNDHIKAVLERLDRKYLLIESRRKPIQL
jgi:hypothetical protein